jgi:Flp pilus assembly protein TadD
MMKMTMMKMTTTRTTNMTTRSALATTALLGALASIGGGCATSGELKQDTFQARKHLANELIARGDFATAFSYADGLHRERPRDAEVLVLRGVIFRDKGMSTEAEGDLREAARLDDTLGEAHAALGILYDLTQRSEQAEIEHQRAVALAPSNARYLNNLGFSLFMRGKAREAISVFGRAARLDPTNHRVRTNLGFALAATGDLRGAVREFEMGGSAAEAKNNLGFAYERRGDLAHAYDLYREASSLDPASTRARSNLTYAASALGRDLPTDGPSSNASSDRSAGGARGVAAFSP